MHCWTYKAGTSHNRMAMCFKNLPWCFSKWSKTWIFYADKGLEDRYQSEKYASDVLTMFKKLDDYMLSLKTLKKSIHHYSHVIINCNNIIIIPVYLLNLTYQIQSAANIKLYILG